MSLTNEEKAEVLAKFGRHDDDTGAPEVQIAMFDKRIKDLQSHLKMHIHDESSRHGLLRLVGKRRRMLAYLRDNHTDRYRAILAELGLRR